MLQPAMMSKRRRKTRVGRTRGFIERLRADARGWARRESDVGGQGQRVFRSGAVAVPQILEQKRNTQTWNLKPETSSTSGRTPGNPAR